MSEPSTDRLVPLETAVVRDPLRDRLADALELQPEDAGLTVDHLIRSEQAGKHDHGLIRVAYLVSSGKFGPFGHRATAVPRRVGPGRIHIDASGHLGYPALHQFIHAGCREASEHGMCVGTSVSLYPSGALFDWAHMAAQEQVGIILVATSPPRVAAPGGQSPIVGTNPICVGMPTRPIPFVSDTATSAINHGELLLARAGGYDLPPDSAIGPDGRATRDAAQVDPTRGLGALLPLGGSHKAFALAMAIEMLVSLGGLRPGQPSTHEHGVCCLFLGPSLTESLSGAGSQWLVDQDAQGTRIPGWESWRAAARRREQGIVEVRPGTRDRLMALL